MQRKHGESIESVAAMQRTNEKNIEAPAMQWRWFELVSTVAQEVETMAKNLDQNMQVLMQYPPVMRIGWSNSRNGTAARDRDPSLRLAAEMRSPT